MKLLCVYVCVLLVISFFFLLFIVVAINATDIVCVCFFFLASVFRMFRQRSTKRQRSTRTRRW